ncbi:MaoC/PaaZ C-terminal domain-containing protein [Gordonia polyisoprenivorans]|uniref:MaoC/PaaZ C-terminal domain-containing protein n=1 Tax=Gordonia polyisoprenivorans TaxID=84595 RepID=UPI000376E82E|nr:MaoC/PaaZ C-terminal domain-containing protein [Gordonia polyisoprenivorans]
MASALHIVGKNSHETPSPPDIMPPHTRGADPAMTDPIVYADDLQPGQRHKLGIHTVSESELVDFASQWDPQAFHVDRAAAESGAFGGLIASGIHSLAIAQRLAVSSVLTSWSVIAGRRLREMEFLAPVRPGDTLSGSMRIESVDLDPRGRGLVTYTTELVNQAGVAVLRFDADVYLRSRGTH